ncbi:pantoate--beta-alanine ligase [Campylobacter porcelli]|uniref:Pantothenate synthetase n=1 Tax=Campylobacter porcelli TaxID=1660073 RepID=A0A1X9SXN7_9BACT|nr:MULTISPECIES: pantoate--beta-alanine ligase [unclassified Campylobacter]ARR01062.1 pantothenate synthetase [Campylobacter sp. RM6137]
MQILKTIQELRDFRAKCSGDVGFVATMGALHAGHAQLIKSSVSQNNHTIVSIFVNPTQFLPGEDLSRYPRTPEADIKICQLCQADAVFMPEVDEIYNQNEIKILAPKELSNTLEGVTRPGHFDGVCTILTKFFNIINPTNAYFGKKDAQQLIIIENMVKSLFMNVNIVPIDIVRSSDGLALSSRNSYLNDDELAQALKISRSLMKASNLIKAGELSSIEIKKAMSSILEPLRVDYIAIVDKNLNPVDKIELGNSIILVAVYVKNTRLIDNLWV